MMKNKKLTTRIVVVILVIASILAISATASATASKPYGSYGVTKTTLKGEATIVFMNQTTIL